MLFSTRTGYWQARCLRAALAYLHKHTISFFSMRQGTGVAIYFPTSRFSYDPWYPRLVSSFPGPLKDWDNLLAALYNVGQSITNSVASGERLWFVWAAL